MLNNFVIVGRLTAKPELVETETGQKCIFVTLAVQRSYKNSEGIYECDFIKCQLWNGIAERTVEYCDKGDLIGIKGRIETKDSNIILIGDKVTFLSSKINNGNESEE